MTINNKIRREALEVALRYPLRLAQRSPERTAHNILELAERITQVQLPQPERAQCYNGLLELIALAANERIITYVEEVYGLC